jgi:hypothetical protein
MSEQTSSVEVLQDLGATCLAAYLTSAPTRALYARAAEGAGERAAALLRRYLESGTTTLRAAIPPDDKGLFLQAGRECLQLAMMGQGLLVLV